MTHISQTTLTSSAERLLLALGARQPTGGANGRRKPSYDPTDVACLLAADLIVRRADRLLDISTAGWAYLARRGALRGGSDLDPFLVQHLDPRYRAAERPEGRVRVTINEAESPLAWLARRKGRNGQPLIAPDRLQAGERLRAEFTRAQLTPRVTSNWTAAVAQGPRGGGAMGAAALTDAVISARERVRQALDAVGPEFAGLLLDVCCFLKGLEDVERERRWPPRSAKVVLQLGLDRLARHYGFSNEARGQAASGVRTWRADSCVDGA